MKDFVLAPTRGRDLDFVVAAEQDPQARVMILPWSRIQHAAALADPDIRDLIGRSDCEPVAFAIPAGIGSEHRSIELRRRNGVEAVRFGLGAVSKPLG